MGIAIITTREQNNVTFTTSLHVIITCRLKLLKFVLTAFRCYFAQRTQLSSILSSAECAAEFTSSYLIGILNYAPSCCRTSQFQKTSFFLSVSFWNDLVFNSVGLASFTSGPMFFLLAYAACSLPLCLLLFSISRFSFYWLVL